LEVAAHNREKDVVARGEHCRVEMAQTVAQGAKAIIFSREL
jgi:hypothetical protein